MEFLVHLIDTDGMQHLELVVDVIDVQYNYYSLTVSQKAQTQAQHRQKTRDRRQEMGHRRWETGDARQEKGDRRRERVL